MIIIGADFHPEFQQIASLDSDTGELQEKRLVHREEAEKFYRSLAVAQHRLGTTNYQRSPQHSKTEWEMVLLRYQTYPKPSPH